MPNIKEKDGSYYYVKNEEYDQLEVETRVGVAVHRDGNQENDFTPIRKQ